MRRVVRAEDADIQGRNRRRRSVGSRIVETVDQRRRIHAKRLNCSVTATMASRRRCRIRSIQRVGVAAVRIQKQRAVAASERADCRNVQCISVHIRIRHISKVARGEMGMDDVCKHVACRSRSVFHNPVRVWISNRRIVRAIDGDGERGVGNIAVSIMNLVGKGLCQSLTLSQGMNCWIGCIQSITICAVSSGNKVAV